MKSCTCTRSHANITDKLKNGNRFSEHFRQKMSIQNNRNGTSRDQNFRSSIFSKIGLNRNVYDNMYRCTGDVRR